MYLILKLHQPVLRKRGSKVIFSFWRHFKVIFSKVADAILKLSTYSCSSFQDEQDRLCLITRSATVLAQ